MKPDWLNNRTTQNLSPTTLEQLRNFACTSCPILQISKVAPTCAPTHLRACPFVRLPACPSSRPHLFALFTPIKLVLLKLGRHHLHHSYCMFLSNHCSSILSHTSPLCPEPNESVSLAAYFTFHVSNFLIQSFTTLSPCHQSLVISHLIFSFPDCIHFIGQTRCLSFYIIQ